MNIRATQVCTWILGLVGDDAAHKVRLSAAQVSHQLVQVLLYLHTKTVFSSKCILFKAVFLKSWWHYLYIYFSDLFSAPFLITLVQLTLCNCETVWKEAAFLLLSLVSDFGSPAETTEQTMLVYYGLGVYVFQIAFVWLSTHVRADVVLKQSGHQFVGGFLEQSHHRLIQRVSVLIQPAGDIVRHLQWDTDQLWLWTDFYSHSPWIDLTLRREKCESCCLIQ